MSDDEHGGVKVTDKRRFNDEGEVRDDVPEKETEPHELPSIDFATFILSLASSAQIHMGVIPNPVTGQPDKNLQIAKQTIDIIGVIQDKTKGNLTKDEHRLVESVLYDLRMKYVELNK